MTHLSDLLHQVHAYRGDWMVAEIADGQLLTPVRASEMYFYIVLKGEVSLRAQTGWARKLSLSDVGMVFGEIEHNVETGTAKDETVITCFEQSRSSDLPMTMSFGSGAPVAKLLIGKIGISWPAVLQPAGLPPHLYIRMGQTRASAREIAATFRRACVGPGAASYLTKLAELAMVRTLRENIEVLKRLAPDLAALQISRVLRLIEADPGAKWSVSRLAREAGMSRSSFAEKFVRLMGKPPMEMVAEYRMRAAANLLETSRASITDISSRVGYQSEAAFSRRFEQEFSMSPGRYRRGSKRRKRDVWLGLTEPSMDME